MRRPFPEREREVGEGPGPAAVMRALGPEPARAPQWTVDGPGAVDWSGKKCEGCQLKRPTFGLPAEGKARWCGGCAKAHAKAAPLARSRGTDEERMCG